MRKITFLFLGLCGLIWTVSAQNPTPRLQLGVHVGGSIDFYNLASNSVGLSTANEFNANRVGALLSYRLGQCDRSFIELDVNYHQQYLGIESNNGAFTNSASAYGFGLLGISYKHQVPLVADRLFLGIRAGFQAGLLESGSTGLGFNTDSPVLGPSYNYYLDDQSGKPLFLVNVGLTLEYRFRNNMQLYLRASYAQGLREFTNADLNYSFGNAPSESLNLSSFGSHAPIELGVSYPISRIWEGKK